jgi:hypothetical protein
VIALRYLPGRSVQIGSQFGLRHEGLPNRSAEPVAVIHKASADRFSASAFRQEGNRSGEGFRSVPTGSDRFDLPAGLIGITSAALPGRVRACRSDGAEAGAGSAPRPPQHAPRCGHRQVAAASSARPAPSYAAGSTARPSCPEWQALIKPLICMALFPSADQVDLQCNQTEEGELAWH